MTTYNFTVRASDNAGAFADRDFSINVRNTVVDRFVMVNAGGGQSSQSGGVLTSDWTSRPGAIGTDISYGAGKWVAYSNASTYRTSTDAINWETHTRPNTNTNRPPAIIYGNGQWMTFGRVGTDSNPNKTCYTSTDCINWTERGTITHVDINSGVQGRFAYGNGKWIALEGAASSSRAGYISTDGGDTWTTFTLGVNSLCIDIAYINGVWFITDSANYCIWASIDAVNWSKRFVTDGSTAVPYRIAYGNGVIFVSWINNNATASTAVGWYSKDGMNWTGAGISGSYAVKSGGNIRVAYAGGKFIAIGNCIMSSPVGITWSYGGANTFGDIAGITFG